MEHYEYRTKVRPINARHWDGKDELSIMIFTKGQARINENDTVTIQTPRGELTAQVGDYIVKDNGILYPLAPAAFWRMCERY
jgi:hypothetical protein